MQEACINQSYPVMSDELRDLIADALGLVCWSSQESAGTCISSQQPQTSHARLVKIELHSSAPIKILGFTFWNATLTRLMKICLAGTRRRFFYLYRSRI
jgi:hypothetical protein